jgi:hypothetical protein
MPEEDDNRLTVEDEAAGAGPTQKPEAARPSVPRRESPQFRQELLSRLPILAAPKWQPSETLDVYQDLQGIVDLDADAFLEPLEPIAEKDHD